MRLMWLCHSVPLKSFFSLHWSLLNAGLFLPSERCDKAKRAEEAVGVCIKMHFSYLTCIITSNHFHWHPICLLQLCAFFGSVLFFVWCMLFSSHQHQPIVYVNTKYKLVGAYYKAYKTPCCILIFKCLLILVASLPQSLALTSYHFAESETAALPWQLAVHQSTKVKKMISRRRGELVVH